MYCSDGRLVLSASDLVGHLACSHLTTLDQFYAESPDGAPTGEDPELALLARRGLEHERAYLEALRARGRTVAEVPQAEGRSLADLRALEEQTLAAMRDGVDVVFQSTFLDDCGRGPAWRGHADFLARVEQPSALGQHAYEPEDTKLARHVKPGAVLQLCHYAEQVARLQGAEPKEIHVVLGGQERRTLRLADFAAYYRTAKRRFVESMAGRPATYPERVSHCAVCRYAETCARQWEADDHLTLVAGLGREPARKLVGHAGIRTVAELAASPDGQPVRGIGADFLKRLRRQARLQVAYREARADDPSALPPFELLPPDGPGTGLSALPEPSPGDLFFDMEGDPFVGDDGLEYLFGVGYVGDDGAFAFQGFWGHDRAGEKQAFERFVDFVVERRRAHPDLHVYHYANYEQAALGKLMGRHATREAEIDTLLRGNVLVDLYRVVRQSLMLGTDSYSIKALEPLYMPKRDAAITNAGSSIVEYERWMETGDEQILADLEKYNRDDCESTLLLRNWLEERRAQAQHQFEVTLPRPEPTDGAAPEGLADDLDEVAALATDLTGGAQDPPALDPDPDADADAGQAGRWLLAQLLDWHRREAKPEWWAYYRRLDATEDELFADSECVAGLEYVGVVRAVNRSLVHRYRFDPEQDHKLKCGDPILDPAVVRARQAGEQRSAPGTLVAVDAVAGTLDLQRGKTSKAEHPRSLMPPGPVPTREQQAALRRLATTVLAVGIDGDGPDRAARDLLLRHPPRTSDDQANRALRRDSEQGVDAAVRLASDLRGGCLPIQGPPGSGKTYAGAQIALALVRQGKRVGVTANSHAVIGNLLKEIVECAGKADDDVRMLQKAEVHQHCGADPVDRAKDNAEVVAALTADEVDLVAGTPWLFARAEMADAVDVLLVDEAGQLSLANTLAVAGAADSLVLIGDPAQLAQPSKGTHPPGAAVSALEHLLDGESTMPPDRGLFLERTRRLHPEICAFVSEVVYEGRLESEDFCSRQTVGEGPVIGGAGIRWAPVEHTGNRSSSEEEAQAVARLYRALLGRPWTDDEGTTNPIGCKDVLVVAPYNAQVALLGQYLEDLPEAEGAPRIGTVDRFQGQQAAVVLVSMTASSAEDVPRGMEFLYSRNRLNVAVSRAKALAVLVASPTLLDVRCRTVEQLRLANGLCRYAEVATPVPAPA